MRWAGPSRSCLARLCTTALHYRRRQPPTDARTVTVSDGLVAQRLVCSPVWSPGEGRLPRPENAAIVADATGNRVSVQKGVGALRAAIKETASELEAKVTVVAGCASEFCVTRSHRPWGSRSVKTKVMIVIQGLQGKPIAASCHGLLQRPRPA